MAIILPIIRILLLGSNLWITFKRLQKPRSRNGGAISVRRLQQYRRDLKSCLGVWAVWSFGMSLECITDRSISFMPFYSELKALSWLILLFARSAIAQPVFTHSIHPLIKPQVPVIDSALDLLQAVAELVTVLLLLPYRWAQSRWSSAALDERDSGEVIGNPPQHRERPITRSQLRTQADVMNALPIQPSHTSSDSNNASNILPPSNGGERSGGESQASSEPIRESTLLVRKRTRGVDATRSSTITALPFNPPPPDITHVGDTESISSNFENHIGHPPQMSLTSQRWDRARSISQPEATTTNRESASQDSAPSWVYPPIPAAYPATPAPTRHLSLSLGSSLLRQHVVNPSQRVERESYPPFPAAYPLTPDSVPNEILPLPMEIDPEDPRNSVYSAGANEKVQEARGLPPLRAMVEIAPDIARQDNASIRSKKYATRRAASATLAHAARLAKDKDLTISSEEQPSAPIQRTRRVVSATMAHATSGSADVNSDQPSSTYKITSQVPRKRSLEPNGHLKMCRDPSPIAPAPHKYPPDGMEPIDLTVSEDDEVAIPEGTAQKKLKLTSRDKQTSDPSISKNKGDVTVDKARLREVLKPRRQEVVPVIDVNGRQHQGEPEVERKPLGERQGSEVRRSTRRPRIQESASRERTRMRSTRNNDIS